MLDYLGEEKSMSPEPQTSRGAPKINRKSTSNFDSRHCEYSLQQWDALSNPHL